MLSSQSILQRLPDLPRWVETRALLLWGGYEIFGLQETPELSFVIRDSDDETIFVVGVPAVTAIQAAVQQNTRGGDVIAPWDQVAWLSRALPERTAARAILHILKDSRHLPTAPADQVRFLDPGLLDQFPIFDELLQELKSGAEHSLIAATFVDRHPVSFCYAGSISESLWDVSIDTLLDHRRKGYAALCAAHLIRHMHAQGKQPVWAALEENPASWRLAQKLGFEVVDELAIFEPAAKVAMPTQTSVA